tara:strand:+ start:393 stop:575 length:183 start_codon:yes stop_codon:yes gene_type:complete
MQNYQITVTPKNITWNNQQYTVTKRAKDAASAIKKARSEYNDTYWNKDFSAATYKAKLAE